jgi:hypothetical protein
MIEIASRPNREAARLLRRTAGLLAEQEEDGFRIRAYRRAADVMDALDRPVGTILEREGIDGLIALPGIGEGIAFGLAEWYRTGKLPALQRLRGKSDPVSLLATVPSLGRKLADRIHHELGIGSLEDLELAAWDGRLDSLPGFGPRRLETIRSALSARLGRRPIVLTSTEDRPPVADLIAVDREYESASASNHHPPPFQSRPPCMVTCSPYHSGWPSLHCPFLEYPHCPSIEAYR